MDNKEIKTNTNELNDEELENVSGGRVQPVVDEKPYKSISCEGCGKVMVVPQETYDDMKANGGYYCKACKAKMA